MKHEPPQVHHAWGGSLSVQGSWMKPIIASADDKVDALAVKVRDRLYAEKHADVYAMGPGGVHQAVKALAVANLLCREEGSLLTFVPEIESKGLVKKEDLIIKFAVQIRTSGVARPSSRRW